MKKEEKYKKYEETLASWEECMTKIGELSHFGFEIENFKKLSVECRKKLRDKTKDLKTRNVVLEKPLIVNEQLDSVEKEGKKENEAGEDANENNKYACYINELFDLIKSYQDEIDFLTKRAKNSEANFLKIFQTIYSAPDIVMNLKIAVNEIKKSEEEFCQNKIRLQELDNLLCEKSENISMLNMEIFSLTNKLKSYQNIAVDLKNKNIEIDSLKKDLELKNIELKDIKKHIVTKIREESESNLNDLKKEIEDLKKKNNCINILKNQYEHESFEIKKDYEKKLHLKYMEIEAFNDEIERQKEININLMKQIHSLSRTSTDDKDQKPEEQNYLLLKEEIAALSMQSKNYENLYRSSLDEIENLKLKMEEEKEKFSEEMKITLEQLENRTTHERDAVKYNGLKGNKTCLENSWNNLVEHERMRFAETCFSNERKGGKGENAKSLKSYILEKLFAKERGARVGSVALGNIFVEEDIEAPQEGDKKNFCFEEKYGENGGGEVDVSCVDCCARKMKEGEQLGTLKVKNSENKKEELGVEQKYTIHHTSVSSKRVNKNNNMASCASQIMPQSCSFAGAPPQYSLSGEQNDSVLPKYTNDKCKELKKQSRMIRSNAVFFPERLLFLLVALLLSTRLTRFFAIVYFVTIHILVVCTILRLAESRLHS